MAAADLSFRAVGLETMRQVWPAFAAGAAIEVWLVGRSRRSRRFRVPVIASLSMATVVLVVALWSESFLATQLVYQTLGEGAIFDVGEELGRQYWTTRPLLVPLGAVLLILAMRPRSEATITVLVVAIGVLASWIVAMWLFTATHSPAMFQLLVLPGGLGVVASLVGFTAATAIWMAIGRWIWREGRRSRRT